MKRFFFLWICLTLCTLACHSTDFVAITEVLYDTPYNEDTTISPHNFGEFIELYNAHELVAGPCKRSPLRRFLHSPLVLSFLRIVLLWLRMEIYIRIMRSVMNNQGRKVGRISMTYIS